MKKQLLASALLLVASVNAIFAQGQLTPTGAPSPTMKTLDQVEPRADVLKLSGDGNSSFIISQPGSYYLTTNIVGISGRNGISIAANNVTLDLNGFAVAGVPSSGEGIRITAARTNVTVRNGTVSGWGNNGIEGYFGAHRNLLFEGLNIAGNTGNGIIIVGDTIVRNCHVQSNSNAGIYLGGGIISDCMARENGSDGIYCIGSSVVVRNCHSETNKGSGIYVDGGFISGCVVRDNVDYGIRAFAGTTIENCQIQSSGGGITASTSIVRDCQITSCTGYGIQANSSTVIDCLVQGCTLAGIFINAPDSQIINNSVRGNNTSANVSSAGIYVNDSRNRIENNNVSGSGVAGIRVSGYTNNVVIKNTVSGNGASNYLGTVSNDFGPIGTAAASTSPWANISH